MNQTIKLEETYGAHHYHPLPVVFVRGQGVHVWDDQGKQYIDMMSAYSAVSHGHCNPELVRTLTEQANTLTIVSQAYHNDKLSAFLKYACERTGMDMALAMNTGAEGVETAIKAARKWAHTVKGVKDNTAEIIACEGNFHGRTTTVVSMSGEAQYKAHFGPLTPGFKLIPYGDVAALEKAITPSTAAFIVEPIQGEGGILVPPEGYLKQCQALCRKHNVLLICDEIQTGLGRTGKLLACQHDDVKPDGLILGKALGGGMLPVSMFLSNKEVMSVFTPGDHGSTFGGNALAASIGLRALQLLDEMHLIENSQKLGAYFKKGIEAIASPYIKEVRGKGLFIGIEVDMNKITARELVLRLLDKGFVSKETHDTVIRLTPPLLINQEQIDQALAALQEVLTS